MGAATSILHRANDAVAKEHRLAAVTELQSRVEDWKGHQIDHFGDLMLFGTFTVLKGEGAKEVEREVRDIFFSLSPKVRKALRRSTGQTRSVLRFSPLKRSLLPSQWMPDAVVSEDSNAQEYTNPNLCTVGRLDPNPYTKAPVDRTVSSSQTRVDQCPKRFVSGLEGVPEEGHEGHAQALSKEISLDDLRARLDKVKQDPSNALRPTLYKKSSKPTFYTKSLGSPLHPNPSSPFPPREGSGSEGSSAPPTPSRSSKGAGASKLADFGSKMRTSKRMFKAVFKKTQPILASDVADCSHLRLFNGPFMRGNHFLGQLPRVDAPAVKSKITKFEKELLAELKLTRPVRIQYKVYLFERILLCCKEVNPNKPKNKMLGNTKPLVDKRGKLRLQLKGRIFMQNVTDVISVNRAG